MKLTTAHALTSYLERNVQDWTQITSTFSLGLENIESGVNSVTVVDKEVEDVALLVLLLFILLP